jgi:hypothetical protein
MPARSETPRLIRLPSPEHSPAGGNVQPSEIALGHLQDSPDLRHAVRVESCRLNERSEIQAIESLGAGTVDEATAAIGRLLAVTQATYERRAQLEHALQSRVAIEQAKGVIAERYGLTAEEAFQVIRRAARTNRMKLHELVQAIRPGEASPPELAAVLTERGNV